MAKPMEPSTTSVNLVLATHLMNRLTVNLCNLNAAGDPVEEHDNPADHFLDVLIASEKAMDAQDLQQQTQPIEMANKQDKPKVINLVDHYTTSSEYKALRSTIDPVLNELERKENENGVLRQRFNCFGGVGFATGFFWQVE